MTESDSNEPTLSLLERWRTGDRSALEQLLGELLPWLHREVSRALNPQQRVEKDSMDLVQNAVLNFLNWGPRFVPHSADQFRALLKRIAMNELIDHARRLSRSGDVGHIESVLGSSSPMSGYALPGHSSLQPDRMAGIAEETEWVRLALQFLSPEDRSLLLMSEVEGIDWATIAREIGLESSDAARMRCVRLKPRVANLLRRLKAGQLPDSP